MAMRMNKCSTMYAHSHNIGFPCNPEWLCLR